MTRRLLGLTAAAVTVAATLLPAGRAAAQGVSDYALFAVSAQTNQLVRRDMAGGATTVVGTVRDSSGTTLSGIAAAAYNPRSSNLLAFWKDPSDGQSKLVYVSLDDATARVVGSPLGAGMITGATTALPTAAAALSGSQPTPLSEVTRRDLYVLQEGVALSGKLNINPNNSADNQFELVKPDGSKIVRNDLFAGNSKVDASGVYYQGPAASVHVLPKGNGTQITLTAFSSTLTIANNDAYDFAGPSLNVTVYNDKVTGNTPAGQWWVSFTADSASLTNASLAGGVGSGVWGQLLKVDYKTGAATAVMPLSQRYEGLAALTSGKFYAVSGSKLVAIDPAAKTETVVGTSSSTQLRSLEFAGSALFAFSDGSQTLVQLDAANAAQVGAAISPNVPFLRGLVFARKIDLPLPTAYD